MIKLRVQSERWPLRGEFRISRESFTYSIMVTVEIHDGEHVGRGECEPHESDLTAIGPVMASICALEHDLERGLTREQLATRLPAGPARNAIDCALWDLEAKRSGKRVWELAQVATREQVETAFTVGIDSPEAMAAKAVEFAQARLIKIKLGGQDSVDLERVRAIRQARPDARLIVDANGGWTLPRLAQLAPELAQLQVKLIEQPLPPGQDDGLEGYRSPVPLCADESCLDRGSLPHVRGRYQYINIKLDKTGGLTEALALARAAQADGIGVMVGCMVGTSLAMGPAMLIAQLAEFVDLDGPVLLAEDRPAGLVYESGQVSLPRRELWG